MKHWMSYITAHPLYNSSKKVVLLRGNPHNPHLLLVGESPGKTENRVGTPFVGSAGKLLDMWLSSSGITDFAITNVVPLMPLDKEGKIRKPSKSEIEYFKPLLFFMIKHIKPQYIILLGSTASEAVLGMKISQSVFKVFEREIEGKMYRIGVVYHPAYYLRRGQSGAEDFENVYREVINE